MRNVLIIYTGGTIGMTRTENGYAPQSGQFRRAMEAIPDLYAEQMPRWDMLEMDPLLDSSNMTVHEWNKIAQLVADHYDAYDGFVVLHGTDTMAYTASALSFMLEGLAKPVILTGSQIPMCEIRSDGRDNLITSLLIAGAEEVHEVCLYFGGKLLRGNRATKFSADGLIAFLSPNYPSLADAGITIRYNESALLPKPKGALKLQLLENIPIGVLKVFPGIQFSLFEQIMTERLDHKDEVIAGLKRADKMHRRIIYALLIVIILLLIYGITLDVLNPDMGLFRGECERSARKQGDLDALRTFGGRRSSRRKKTTPGLDFCRKRLS